MQIKPTNTDFVRLIDTNLVFISQQIETTSKPVCPKYFI